MKQDDRKQALLDAAKELLKEENEPERLTSRRIAAKAGVNAAMINYYYRSKDRLLRKAVRELLNVTDGFFGTPPVSGLSPKERLREELRAVCVVVLRYSRYACVYVPHLLLEDEIRFPDFILPEIRAHFGGEKSETECKIAAYQLISFLQLAFYRVDEFFRYTGLNISEDKACRALIDMELDLLLPERRPDLP